MCKLCLVTSVEYIDKQWDLRQEAKGNDCLVEWFIWKPEV